MQGNYERHNAAADEPITGILAADLAVGSTVKLMEGGTAAEERHSQQLAVAHIKCE